MRMHGLFRDHDQAEKPNCKTISQLINELRYYILGTLVEAELLASIPDTGLPTPPPLAAAAA